MRIHALAAAGLVATLGAAASADFVLSFEDFTASGFNFTMLTAQGELAGTLTGVTIDAVLVQPGANFTWASDLSIVVSDDALDAPYYVQVGGFSQIAGVLEYTDGLNGFSAAAGTIVSYTYDLLSPIEMSDKSVWLGNGYASGGDGVWTGSVTLHGVSQIPAPGAIALVGLAGLVARRRRA